jgi:hypothetical protein
MALSKERRAELVARAATLRLHARELEAQQQKIEDLGSGDAGDRHYLLGVRIRQLRETARLIEEPVLDAIEDDIQRDP